MISLPEPETDCPCWDTLVAATIARFNGGNKIRTSQKLESELFQVVKVWLPNYKIYCGNNIKTPWGTYKFNFVAWSIQASKNKLPEFIEGREYGQMAVNPRRESPYSDSYRKITWETGYLIGLHERGCGE